MSNHKICKLLYNFFFRFFKTYIIMSNPIKKAENITELEMLKNKIYWK